VQGKNIAVRVTRGERLPPLLDDPVQLRQVVLNLVVNAAEAIALAADGAREIRIDARQPVAERIALAIRDSGVGVEPSELESIFEPVSTKPQGLGMGLAISRSIVEAQGGRNLGHAERRQGSHASCRAAVRPVEYPRPLTPSAARERAMAACSASLFRPILGAADPLHLVPADGAASLPRVRRQCNGV
jgi:signal transduction histidine kinase